MRTLYDEKKKAVKVSAYFKDFDGDVMKWKDAFYNIWRYQMTWDFAHEIYLSDMRQNGVRIVMSVKPAYVDYLISTMEDLGYNKVEQETVYIGEVWACEHPEFENIETLVVV